MLFQQVPLIPLIPLISKLGHLSNRDKMRFLKIGMALTFQNFDDFLRAR